MNDTTVHEEVKSLTYRRSGQIGELAAAMARAQAKLPALLKNKVNPDKNSRYADLASVLECLQPLHEEGIAIWQFPSSNGSGEITVTTLMVLGEQWVESDLTLVSMRIMKGGERVAWLDPQGVGTGITYARRYALQAMAGLAGADDDGEAITKQFHQAREHGRHEQQQQQQQRVQSIGSAITHAPADPEPAADPIPSMFQAPDNLSQEWYGALEQVHAVLSEFAVSRNAPEVTNMWLEFREYLNKRGLPMDRQMQILEKHIGQDKRKVFVYRYGMAFATDCLLELSDIIAKGGGAGDPQA